MKSEIIEEAYNAYYNNFSGKPEIIAYAPGRVNLIGEHTDYNDGFVCPFAIELHTIVVGRRISGNVCYVVTTQPEMHPASVSFYGDESLVPIEGNEWANYVKGVVASYRSEFNLDSIAFEIAISTNVPLGGGLSSSASLEVAVATFIEQAYKLDKDPVKRALLCQKAEHEYAHVKCGIMDQFISSCGKEGHALLIDCRSRDTTEVPLNDPSITLIICNSNKKHELNDGGYVARVNQCNTAVAELKKINKDIIKLRDASEEELESIKSRIDEISYKRAKHSITEDKRTLNCLRALIQNDLNLVGQLMYQSHYSLKDNYEVSTPELDTLVEIAKSLPGVYGSRMTGGGFGGCTVTLCQSSEKDNIMREMAKQYKEQTGLECTIFATKPGQGAHIIDTSEVQICPRMCIKMKKINWYYVAAAAIAVIGVATYLSKNSKCCRK